MPSSVISQQSMHLGILATASHAVTTNTLFTVYYKPRLEIFSFIRMLGYAITMKDFLTILKCIYQDKSVHYRFEQVSGGY